MPDYRDPQERTETNLIHQSALSKVHGLPAEQRAVIVLKFVDGLENRDIGQVLGKSQGAIRILQMRGLSSIRKRMQREMDQHEPNVVGGTGRLFAANQQR